VAQPFRAAIRRPAPIAGLKPWPRQFNLRHVRLALTKCSEDRCELLDFKTASIPNSSESA
jgi:hypothetical protein